MPYTTLALLRLHHLHEEHILTQGGGESWRREISKHCDRGVGLNIYFCLWLSKLCSLKHLHARGRDDTIQRWLWIWPRQLKRPGRVSVGRFSGREWVTERQIDLIQLLGTPFPASSQRDSCEEPGWCCVYRACAQILAERSGEMSNLQDR